MLDIKPLYTYKVTFNHLLLNKSQKLKHCEGIIIYKYLECNDEIYFRRVFFFNFFYF